MQLQQLISKFQTNAHALRRTGVTGPIGIDFGLEQINLVQITKLFDDFKITAAVSIPYSMNREELLQNPVLLKKLIKGALDKNNFKKNKIVAALPPNLIQLVLVNYHCPRNQDHSAALLKTISDQFSEKIEGAVIDYLPIRPKVEDQLDRSALVAIAKHDDVTQFLETLRLADLKVKALEIGPVAIKRLLTNLENKNDVPHKVMSINFALNNSFLTVLWDGELLLDRQVNIGLNSILDTVSEALDMSREQAHKFMLTHGFPSPDSKQGIAADNFFNEDMNSSLTHILKPIFMRFAQEVKKVLIYTAAETQGGAIDIVYVLGSVARWPFVDQYLTNLINLPAKTINPFFGLSEENSSFDIADIESISGIAVTTGLALHGFNKDV